MQLTDKDYTIQCWTMDVERLKRGGILTDEFFERQLEQIREIRLSERKFYQKITDIYATALDYDPTAGRPFPLHYPITCYIIRSFGLKHTGRKREGEH